MQCSYVIGDALIYGKYSIWLISQLWGDKCDGVDGGKNMKNYVEQSVQMRRWESWTDQHIEVPLHCFLQYFLWSKGLNPNVANISG